MSTLLEALREAQIVDALDHGFARAVGRLSGVTDDAVLAAAALASRSPSRGHICVQLDRVAAVLAHEHGVPDEDAPADHTQPDLPVLPDAEDWLRRLQGATPAIRQASEKRRTALVLDRGALYLDRYWDYERRLADALLARVARPLSGLDTARLRAVLDALFPLPRDPSIGPEATTLPRRACATALASRLTVVSGGPGTGKTSVVARLLAVLNHAATQAGEPLPRVLMVAPTGKAAARLTESIGQQLADPERIPEPYRANVEAPSSTIHGALGVVRWGSPRFRHDADNPLAVDVLVVDEASMVDLPTMTKLVEAVPPHARLILLGDPDQLVSVELGSVLGDVCAAARSGSRTSGFDATLQALGASPPEGPTVAGSPRLADVHTHLLHTWRYGSTSGIRKVAVAIQQERAPEVLRLLDDPAVDDVSRLEPPASARGLRGLLEKDLVARYRPVVTATDPTVALQALASFRVLCAHRRGAWGVQRLNGEVETWLAEAGHIRPEEPWYPGRPVLVTRNDPTLGLRNGDVGIVLADPDAPEARKVWFMGEQGTLRWFRPGALPDHDTVYTTTVHKAQGSEYDDVLVILPRKRSGVVTRELLYTAVTRAKKSARVLGDPAVITGAVDTTIQRMSGLQARLD